MQTLSAPAETDMALDDLVYRPGVYMVRITPDDAQQLLLRNTKNRPAKANAINRYADSMAEGKWRRTNQGIGISRQGELVDGQNRLMACIQAGVPFDTLLATGLDGDAKDVVDTGVKRSLGDSFRMAGHTNAVALAGAVMLRMRYEDAVADGQPWTYGRRRDIHIPHGDALAFLDAHPDLMETTTRSWVLRKVFNRVPISVIAAFMSLAREYDVFQAEEFEQGLITGANLDLGDPRLVLRNYLMRREDNYSRGKHSLHLLGMFIKAFNDFVHGEKREILVLKDSEPMPMVGAKRRPRKDPAGGRLSSDGEVEDVDLATSEVALA